MDHTTMLTRILKRQLGWRLAQVTCLSCPMIALFKVKTMNIAELDTVFSGTANVMPLE